jgi:hypothetical protein
MSCPGRAAGVSAATISTQWTGSRTTWKTNSPDRSKPSPDHARKPYRDFADQVASRHLRSRPRRHHRCAEIPQCALPGNAVARLAARRQRSSARPLSRDDHRDVARRNLRSHRRRAGALFGRRTMARAAFREDALRQRPFHPPLASGRIPKRIRFVPDTNRRDYRLAACARWPCQPAVFAASLDADSEGVEGKYYVWSLNEVADVLGDDAEAPLPQTYDISPMGNWEGSNIPNLSAFRRTGTALVPRSIVSPKSRQAAQTPAEPDTARPRWQGSRRLERLRNPRHRGGRTLFRIRIVAASSPA